MKKLIWILPLLCSLSWAANLRVQGLTQRSNGAGNTNALAYGSSPTSGNVLTVFGLSTQTLTISDSQGNTWHQGCATGAGTCTGSAVTDTNGCVHDVSGGGIGFLCMWYTTPATTAADTVTITTATANISNLWIEEWSGDTAFDVAAVSNGNSSFNASCTSAASAAVAGAGELIVGDGADSGNDTYTPTGAFTTNDAAAKLNNQQVMYSLSSASGAQTFSATISGSANWMCEGMAFKAGAITAHTMPPAVY